MLIAAILLLAGTPPTISAASVSLRSTAHAALPASSFPVSLSITDEKGVVAGKVVSVDQGLVTVKTQHAFVRIPASAFISKGSLVTIGLSAAQIDVLARSTTSAK